MKKMFLRISNSIKNLIIGFIRKQPFYVRHKKLERESLRKNFIALKILSIGSILTESMFVELYLEIKQQEESDCDESTLAKYQKNFEQEKLHLMDLIKKLKQLPINFSPEINSTILNWKIEACTSLQETENIEEILIDYIMRLDFT